MVNTLETNSTRRQVSLTFLQSRNLTADKILASIRPVSDDEDLLLVGSVSEGNATEKSDIDLALLSMKPVTNHNGILAEHSWCQENNFYIGRNSIGFERYKLEEIQKIGPLMKVMHEKLLGQKDETVYKYPQLQLKGDQICMMVLHRIKTGITLIDNGVAETWRKALFLDDLNEYIMYTWGVWYIAAKGDYESQERGNHESGILSLRRTVANLIDIFCAAYGLTNVKSKWQVTKLNALRNVVAEPIIRNLIDLMVYTTAANAYSNEIKQSLEKAKIDVYEAVLNHSKYQVTSRILEPDGRSWEDDKVVHGYH